MLTSLATTRRQSFIVLLPALLTLAATTPAQASGRPEDRRPVSVTLDAFGQTVNYQVGKGAAAQPGTRPAPTSSGRGAPSTTPRCELTGTATYCYNGNPCYFSTSKVIPLAPPKTPQPSPGAAWGVRWCQDSTYNGGIPSWSGTPVWVTDAAGGAPTLYQQAMTAYGSLTLPDITLDTSPPTRAIVNLPTFIAPAKTVAQQVTGTNALGLTAVATLTTIQIDPGDTTPPITCTGTVKIPPPQATSSPCSHTYLKSSAGQPRSTPAGDPAYALTTTATYTVTYRLNGTPTTIRGAPTTITSPATTTLLPVAEIQIISDR